MPSPEGAVAPAERPADFAVYYQNYSAPLPPPHASQHRIWIGPAPEGVVEMTPGDRSPATPTWTERFPLQAAHLDWLFQTLREQGALDGEWIESRDVPVGGGSETVTIVAGGRNITIPAFVAEARADSARAIFAAIRALMPPAIWQLLSARREAYIAQYANQPFGPGPVPGPHASPIAGALHDPVSVLIAAILGGPLAGAVVMAINFNRLGQPQSAFGVTAVGAVGTVVVLLLHATPLFVFGVGVGLAVGLMSYAKQSQAAAVDLHRAHGGRVASRWAAVAIAIPFFALELWVGLQQNAGSGLFSNSD